MMKSYTVSIPFFKIFFSLTIAVFIFQRTAIGEFIPYNVMIFFLLITLFSLLLTNRLLKCFNYPLFIWFFLYIFWCVLTSFWSNTFLISLSKSLLLGLVAITFSSAGYEWIRRYSWQNSLSWLKLIFCITIASAIGGELSAQSSNVLNSAQIVTYSGIMGASASNFFGFLCAICFPLLLWNMRKNWLWFSLILLDLFYLFRSFSRSAMIIVATISIFWILSLKLKKKLFIFVIAGLMSVLICFLAPPLVENIMYKNVSHEDVLKTRQSVWEMSYTAAQQGGLVGVGYGSFASLGSSGLQGTLNSYIYHKDNSREKGNSQLAAVEETGWIGLSLHLIFLWVFFTSAIKCWRRLPHQEKILLGIILGALLGLLLQSIFEAWWSGPFSQENVYFWLMFGIARGCMGYMPREKLA